MIGTAESDSESIRKNISSMICNKNKELKFKIFSKECTKLCSSGKGQIVGKGEVKHKKI